MGALLDLALKRSIDAEATGALVPLETELVPLPGSAPFLLRRLLSETPKHFFSARPKPNPFLPWEPALEVQPLRDQHVLILNKFPVQRGHLLLITRQWQPQSGWLNHADWQAVAEVEADTSGLWFFNSCAEAGASQPHRHLQLLPRHGQQISCPLAPALCDQLATGERIWPWRYRLSERRCYGSKEAGEELLELYSNHLEQLGIGDARQHDHPQRPYNLLMDRQWFMTVERVREHWAGFSINALGYAGCLLITEHSKQQWLIENGPMALLQAVAAPMR